jgi:hypothetical protein
MSGSVLRVNDFINQQQSAPSGFIFIQLCVNLNQQLCMKKLLLLTLVVMLGYAQSKAQTGKSQVVRVNAVANANGTITLKWPAETWSGTFEIARRALGTVSWNTAASVAGSSSSWTDNTVKKGEAFEYLVAKASGGSNSALGYIWAGNTLPETPGLGGIIVLVDSAYLKALSTEMVALQQQLKEEGWIVSSISAGRGESPQTVRNRIIAEYNRRKGAVKTLLIIGHVPVPYSGNYLAATGQVYPPDGHPDHAGAWPADGYYGDMDGVWTDASVTNTVGSQTRNHNIPGDGKFDQTKLPGTVELEVGRVDLFNMPAFSNNDTLLVRKYLRRNMLWRTNRLTTVERALIDDNFGTLNLSSTAFQNFSCMFPTDSIYENRDYISTQKNSPYLWSYGCGGGSNTSCGGIGTTSSFVADSMQNIFTMLAGSYFGDWDQQNNILRAPLCNSALSSAWGGIPKWYVHHMALGRNIGYGAKLSMNNVTDYWNGGFNLSDNKVHIALLGDPTLKMRHVAPVKKLTAVSQSNYVKLSWSKALGKHDGYAVYRYDTVENTYYRVNKNHIIKDTFYNDSTNYFNGRNTYTVRPIRLETTASGTWYNLGAGPFVSLNHTNGRKVLSAQLMGISIHPNPGHAEVTVSLASPADHGWLVTLTDLTGRVLVKKEMKAGSKSLNIHTEGLPQGCYMVLVSHHGQFVAADKWIKN